MYPELVSSCTFQLEETHSLLKLKSSPFSSCKHDMHWGEENVWSTISLKNFTKHGNYSVTKRLCISFKLKGNKYYEIKSLQNKHGFVCKAKVCAFHSRRF